MTVPETAILGRAQFGTSNGLVAQGNGVLSGVRQAVSLFDFDEGRNRDGLLHALKEDSPVLFYRRGESEYGEQVALVGLLAPCRDSSMRAGFFGSCVAVNPDRIRPRPSFGDWASLADSLYELYDVLRPQVDPESRQLRFRGGGLQDTGDHHPSEWEVPHAETVVLYADEGIQNDEDQILEALQAMAFAGGSRFATVMIIGEPLKGAYPISSKEVQAAVEKLRDAKRRKPEVFEKSQETLDSGLETAVRNTLNSDQISMLQARNRELEAEVIELRAANEGLHRFAEEVQDELDRVLGRRNVQQQKLARSPMTIADEEAREDRIYYAKLIGVLTLAFAAAIIGLMFSADYFFGGEDPAKSVPAEISAPSETEESEGSP